MIYEGISPRGIRIHSQIIDQVQNYVVKGVDVKNQNSVVMASQVDVAAFFGRCLHAYAIDFAA